MTGTLYLLSQSSLRVCILPWLCALHTSLSSGFAPVLGGAVPSAVTAWHPTSSGSVPSTILGDLSPEYPAYGTHNMMEDQRLGAPDWQYTESDVHSEVPGMDSVLNPCEVPQASSPAAAQTQPHVAGAQESAPMDYEVSPHGSGVEQQQPIPRDHTKVLNSGGDLANISAGPAALEAVCEMSGDEWTGTLYLNGVCAQARARATEAVRNPKLSAWPSHLQLEPVFDSQINILDIRAWMDETKAPVVRLSCRDVTDKRQFCRLVGTLRSDGGDGGYAVVRWGNGGQTKERLLLAPLSEGLLCAAFTDDGIPNRPTRRQPRRIGITKRSESSQKKNRSRGICVIKCPKNSQKKKRPRRGPRWLPATCRFTLLTVRCCEAQEPRPIRVLKQTPGRAFRNNANVHRRTMRRGNAEYDHSAEPTVRIRRGPPRSRR
ncbi:hypothetical protein DFH94DRAFT_787675 [Russula ochroleuca]|uniref:Uncharacterized protein n=1 Tax=Russula ochroleuca TaxID=152965 RepID=A0A9P5MPU0_9AGAM|nr:hypothetical protein DFH94DRAFT_787675 [Russula ochroleuca]